MNTSARVIKILHEAKRLAREYYNVTRRPLGVTGEVAEYEAVRLLRLKLAPPRQAGFDATRKTSRGVRRFQIKGRRILPDSKPGQRMGSIRVKHEWDAELLWWCLTARSTPLRSTRRNARRSDGLLSLPARRLATSEGL